ncbi:MAG: hypothetical protein GY909_17190 [Oligoflexia bacterium]|nr:hypothetical protein [Oligoflexia bacterium]
MRTIFIGDIHGCFDEFKLMLEKLNYNSQNDRLIILGDIINKGPKSYEALKYVRDHHIEMILGNHEYGFIKYCEQNRSESPGFNSLKERILADKNEDLDEWLNFLRRQPRYIEEEDWIAVHGGLHPQKTLEETEDDFLLFVREIDDRAWFDFYKGNKKVIFGHWASLGLFSNEKVICLDSRCCYGGSLSAFIYEENKIIQVKALKAYAKVVIRA